MLRKVLPGIRALRDVTPKKLEEHASILGQKVFSRCRHVVTENERVKGAVRALETGDIRALGPLMRDSHRSLRDDYEVSCKELNLMTEIATTQRGVVGARMTGGGFGGCTINLVESAAVEAFQRNVAAQYLAQTGLKPEIYISSASDGVQQVEVSSNNVGP
jgi:galactokinase